MVRLATILITLISIVSGILVDAQSNYAETTIAPLNCPEESISPEQAYNDEMSKNPTGLMDCFC